MEEKIREKVEKKYDKKVIVVEKFAERKDAQEVLDIYKEHCEDCWEEFLDWREEGYVTAEIGKGDLIPYGDCYIAEFDDEFEEGLVVLYWIAAS